MTRRTLHQRPGVTVAEVLIAMFTMAIGMICLMTLFPLGALQVGQALRDDRCRQTALQADAYMRAYWRHQVVDPLAVGNLPTEPFFWTMDDVNLYDPLNNATPPKIFKTGTNGIFLNNFVQIKLPSTGVTIPNTTPGSPVSATMLTGDIYKDPTVAPVLPVPPAYAAYATFGVPNANPSYPVMVDPLLEQNWQGISKYWVAGSTLNDVNAYLLPRRQLSVVGTSQPLALQIAGMTDDMSFETNGAPTGGPILGRQGRYTWSAIIQRPRNDIRNVANLTILVFDGRPLLPLAGDEVVINPDSGSPAGNRTLQITLPDRAIDQPLLLRKGGWIMDGGPQNLTQPVQMVNFYRISGIVEVSAAGGKTSYDVDLETPLKSNILPTSQLYLFAGLAEVFERPTLKPDTNY